MAPGVLVTAWHVLVDVGAERPGAVVGVDGLAPGGAPVMPAEVVRVDALHDLAVLVRQVPLPASVSRLVATDEQALRTEVVVTGHCVVPDDPGRSPPRYLDAAGRWAGGTTRADAVPLGRLSSADVMTGMSGAPVRRLSDDAVMGVVSARYNSTDGWLRDSVWVVRTEDLLPLLAGLAEVEVAGAPLTGAVDLLLAVDATQVRLTGAGIDVRAAHGGVRPGLAAALDDVRRARARAGTIRTEPAGGLGAVSVSMRRAGQLLAESFLPGPVADALAGVLRRAQASWHPVRLGIQLDPSAAGWAQLPWEALPDPVSGLPLALHRLVTVYRQVTAGVPRPVPGPLRIVVAISAPATGGGAVLDYEAELRAVLAAVKGARAGDARVQIVPFATTPAIKDALAGGDVHVLHLSAHGGPGTLDLEDDAGAACRVTAQQFLEQAVPPDCMPPVIALAACYTDAPAAAQAPSFAAELLARGAAAVIGTETSVTDRYATRVFARVYNELTHAPTPDVVAAVAQARRAVQGELVTATNPRDQAIAGLDEWGILTVLSAAGSTIVYDPRTTPVGAAASGPAQPAGRSFAGLLARDPGEFVGRRIEQRSLPAVLSGGTLAGVVLHGIGGVGKTTLAAETIRRTLERDPARVAATVTGETNIDAVLAAAIDALRRPLLMASDQAGATAMHALSVASRLDLPWQERLAVLREYVLEAAPLLLVLDNFEDNLINSGGQPREFRDESLAGLLAAWAQTPGRSRLLVTCRYPFRLPDDAGTRLLWRQLGPLTAAETLKLVWSLPSLDALEDGEIEQAWRMVGGHPRTLEYVDALLGRGQGRFPDITTRLTERVTRVLGDDQAQAWLTNERTLDAALADAVTVAADDVLLTDLLAGLSADARRLLLGVSVYREPVDLHALLFQVGEPDEDAGWLPDRAAAEQRILATLATHNIDAAALNQALQTGTMETLPPDLVTALTPDMAELFATPSPPCSTTLDLPSLVEALAGTSLLTLDSDGGTVVVHRWTAAELARSTGATGDDAEVTAAHQRAAAYWAWRVEVWPQGAQADVHDRLEARHHLLAADDLDTANEVTEHVCSQLEQWGAWDHAGALAHDALRRLPTDDPRRAAWSYQLGILAHRRGDYDEAERRYQQALDIDERLGNQAGIATSYHQLGILAHDRGDYPKAERRYQQALDINERLGNQANIATSYHQLGRLAHDRGDYPEAERRYQQSLDIDERLGNQAGIATSRSQIGILRSAQERPVEAIRWHVQALATRLALGVSQGSNSIDALARLRAELGDGVFVPQVQDILDEESTTALLALLDDFVVEQPPSATST